MLGLIKRSFTYMDESMFILLYKSLIRPILEYGAPVWNPHLIKHIKKLESVQRRATKIVTGLNGLAYTQRLVHLGLPTLLYRRDRQDLILVFQILHTGESHPLHHLFNLNNDTRLRGHSRKLRKSGHYHYDARKYFFSERVINTWNSLPDFVVEAADTNMFKSYLNGSNWHNHKFSFH